MSLFNKNRTIKPEYIVFKDSTKKYFDKQLSLIQRNVSVCARERWRAFTCESFACLELKEKKSQRPKRLRGCLTNATYRRTWYRLNIDHIDVSSYSYESMMVCLLYIHISKKKLIPLRLSSLLFSDWRKKHATIPYKTTWKALVKR